MKLAGFCRATNPSPVRRAYPVTDQNSQMCKLSRKLYGRAPACDAGGRGSNLGRDMSASGALLEDGENGGQVSP